MSFKSGKSYPFGSPFPCLSCGRILLICHFSQGVFSNFSSIFAAGIQDHTEIMSSRFDKRLEEAGLLKVRSTPSPSPASPYSSSEDLMNNADDPGYAKLSILNPPPKSDAKKPEHTEKDPEDDEDAYACPADAIKSLPPLPPQGGEEEGEEAYAIPADAVKKLSPKMQQIHTQHRFPSSSSPPTSPLVTDPPKKREVMSGYESVDDIRKMREKQIRKKGGVVESDASRREKGHLERVSSDESSGGGSTKALPAVKMQFEDEEQVYSQPFDALKGNRVRMASDSTAVRPTWQRTNSNGKKGAEPSARFLHHIGSNTSIKSLPEDSTSSSSDQPPEVPAHKRSASSNAKVMFTPRKPSPTRLMSPSNTTVPPLGGGGGGGRKSPNDRSPTSPKPIVGGGKHSPATSMRLSSLGGTKAPLLGGRQRSQTEVTSPVSPRTRNLTSPDSGTQGKVSRYILEVENSEDSRAETGRTHSIDSTLTPAKVTKLRNGRDCVTFVSGAPPKTDKQ